MSDEASPQARVDAQSLDGRLFAAARDGDVDALRGFLDEHPEKLHLRHGEYEWTLLHAAAQNGHLAAVDLLLGRGIDANAREPGDNTCAMHWAAAGGHLDVVRRLADAGGDVVGAGDDHALEVIGWATCWHNYHADIAEFLVSRGAHHHIFSAIALDLGAEVRRIVSANPAALQQRLTRNDGHRTPLHFAVLNDRPRMVALLLELGADPLATDDAGFQPAMYATTPGADRALLERLREMTAAELDSARRGHRAPRARLVDGIAALALGDWDTAALLLGDMPTATNKRGADSGLLHIMAKRGDARAVEWLLDHGADPNARWGDADVTPLHFAAAQAHDDVVRLLLAAGGDPRIRDTTHDGDAIGWAEYGRNPQAPRWREIVRIIEEHEATAS